MKKYKILAEAELVRLLVCGLLGAAVFGRLLFAIAAKPSGIKEFFFFVLFGGFVFYGGAAGTCIGIGLAAWRRKRHFLDYTDVFCTLLPGGQALGRLGCYLNGCCYGREYEGPMAVNYPVEGVWQHVFPTWFAEALFCAVLFVFFQAVCTVSKRGLQTGIYLMCYSLFRFWLEFWRGDGIRGGWGGLSTSQWFAAAAFLGGAAAFLYAEYRRADNPLLG